MLKYSSIYIGVFSRNLLQIGGASRTALSHINFGDSFNYFLFLSFNRIHISLSLFHIFFIGFCLPVSNSIVFISLYH